MARSHVVDPHRFKAMAAQGCAAEEISRELGINLTSVYRALKRFGLKPLQDRKPWTAHEIERLTALHRQHMTAPEIAEKLGRFVWQVQKKCQRLGLKLVVGRPARNRDYSDGPPIGVDSYDEMLRRNNVGACNELLERLWRYHPLDARG